MVVKPVAEQVQVGKFSPHRRQLDPGDHLDAVLLPGCKCCVDAIDVVVVA